MGEKDSSGKNSNANSQAATDKKLVLVATENAEKVKKIQELVERYVQKAVVFQATDGAAALAKINNAPPHILITDQNLQKLSGLSLVEEVLKLRTAERTGIVIIGQPPKEEKHLDEIVTNKVQFVTNEDDMNELNSCIVKALNFNSHSTKADFYIRYLTKDDVLLREGDKADFVYFVKKGELRAYKETAPGTQNVLGNIGCGEFVGEMAYINGEPRSANVAAVTDCELIEVPLGIFEKVLFSRPTWSKALMMTLSKRIKSANQHAKK